MRDSDQQIIIGIMLCAATLVVFLRAKPFQDPTLHALNLLSVLTQAMTLGVALVLRILAEQDGSHVEWACSAVVIGAHSCFLLTVLMVFFAAHMVLPVHARLFAEGHPFSVPDTEYKS